MPYEIEGFKLTGLHKKVDGESKFDNAFEQLNNHPSKIVWKHPNLKLLGFDPTALILGIDDDKTSTIKNYSLNTPTSRRTLCFEVHDNFGIARYVIKGSGLTPNDFYGADVVSNTEFIHSRRFRFSGSMDMSGKESISSASADIGGFMELVGLDQQLAIDFNGPFWQPIMTINTGKKIIEDDYVLVGNQWILCPFVQYQAIDVRRFPYTHWRVEDLSFDSAKSEGAMELEKLRKMWNLSDRSQVYIRSIGRWSRANRELINSRVRHRQVFNNCLHGKTNLEFAWINTNNIGLDGSTGDLDCSRKYKDDLGWNDTKSGRLEAVGGFLIYLYGVYKVDPQLLDNSEFLNLAVKTFFENIGLKTIQDIKQQADFLQVAKLCTNSIALYNLGISNNEIMPDISPYQRNKITKETLPFLVNIALKMADLVS